MVKKTAYIPDRGDVAWVGFDPTKGHEQRGRRPALVLSPKAYNAKSGLALCCPVTSAAKGYPFEVPVRVRGVEGVVLADQLRTLDWRARAFEKSGRASAAALAQAQELVKKLVNE